MKRIDVLPDDVLLEIFDFYLDVRAGVRNTGRGLAVEAWQLLVHVCRRWRTLIFRSPRRLNLRLYCTSKTPAKDTLDVWPTLPLIVEGVASSSGTDNIIAALGQSNRIHEISLRGRAGRPLEKVLATMEVPYPELTVIRLSSVHVIRQIIPDLFLGGSAPRLQYVDLSGIPFPGLPKLLLSTNHLVYLHLSNIPHSGYISPEAMVALISVLPTLASFHLGFESPQSRPDRGSQSLPPPKHSILPALYEFRFTGVTEYLEELVTRIDTPQLKTLEIIFFNQTDFDIPQLAQFISRKPTLTAPDKAFVQFAEITSSIELQYRTSESGLEIALAISCRESDWQVSSIEQVCNSFLPPILVEDLYIRVDSNGVWKNVVIENAQWLQTLLPFTAVKDLYLSKIHAPGIAAALQELVGGRTTEVLPSLQNIFVEGLGVEPSGPFQENIGLFVAARQLSDHPITISDWDDDLDEDSSDLDEDPDPDWDEN